MILALNLGFLIIVIASIVFLTYRTVVTSSRYRSNPPPSDFITPQAKERSEKLERRIAELEYQVIRGGVVGGAGGAGGHGGAGGSNGGSSGGQGESGGPPSDPEFAEPGEPGEPGKPGNKAGRGGDGGQGGAGGRAVRGDSPLDNGTKDEGQSQ